MSGKTFNLRMTEEEYLRLGQLSQELNCPMSQILKSVLNMNVNTTNNIEKRLLYEKMKSFYSLVEKIEKETNFNTDECREEMLRACQLLNSSMK